MPRPWTERPSSTVRGLHEVDEVDGAAAFPGVRAVATRTSAPASTRTAATAAVCCTAPPRWSLILDPVPFSDGGPTRIHGRASPAVWWPDVAGRGAIRAN